MPSMYFYHLQWSSSAFTFGVWNYHESLWKSPQSELHHSMELNASAVTSLVRWKTVKSVAWIKAIWNKMENLPKNAKNIVERVRQYWTFLRGIWQESGMRPQVVNLLFLFSRLLWMTWQSQRNSTISAGPEESNLGFLQATKSHIKTQYSCNDTRTAWEVFYDTSTIHRFGFRCSSLVFVLKKGHNGQCLKNE